MSELEGNKICHKLSSRIESRWHEHEQESKGKISSVTGVQYVYKTKPKNSKQNSHSSPLELYRRNSRWDVPPTQHKRNGRSIPTLKQPVFPYQSRLIEHKNSYDLKVHDLENQQHCSEGTISDLNIDISSDDNNNHNSDSNNNNDDVNNRNSYDHNFRPLIHTADSPSSLTELDIADRFAFMSSESCKEDSPATKKSDSVHNAPLKGNMLGELDFDVEHFPGLNAQELVKSKDLNIKLVKRDKHDQRMERENHRRLGWSRFVQPKDTDSDGLNSSMLQDSEQNIFPKLTSNEIFTSSFTGAKIPLKRKSVDIIDEIEDMRTLIESRREKRAHHEISQLQKFEESRRNSLDKEKSSQLHGHWQENAQSKVKQVGKELSKRGSEQKLSGQTGTNQKPWESLSCKVKLQRGVELTSYSKLMYVSKTNHLMVSSKAFEVKSNDKEKTAGTSETESLTSNVASGKSFPSNEEVEDKVSDIQEENWNDESDCFQKKSGIMCGGQEACSVNDAQLVEFTGVGDDQNSEEVLSSSSKQGLDCHQYDCDQTDASVSVTKTAVISKPSDSGALEISGEIDESGDRLIESEDKSSNSEEVTSEENRDGLHLESDIIILKEKLVTCKRGQLQKNSMIVSDDISIVFENVVTRHVTLPTFRKCESCSHRDAKLNCEEEPQTNLIERVNIFKEPNKSDELPNKKECSTENNISGKDGAIVKKESFPVIPFGNKSDRVISLSPGAKNWRKRDSHDDINSTFSMDVCDVCFALGRVEIIKQSIQSTHLVNAFVCGETDGKKSQYDKLSNSLGKETEQISSTSSCFSKNAGHPDKKKKTNNEKSFKQGRNSDGNMIALKVSIEKHRLFSRKSHKVLMRKLDSSLQVRPNDSFTKAESSSPFSDSHHSTSARNLGKDASYNQRRKRDLLGDLNRGEGKDLITCFENKSPSKLFSENAKNWYSYSDGAKNVAHVCHTNQLPDYSKCNINMNNNSCGKNNKIRRLSPSDGVLGATVCTRTHISIRRELDCNEILVKCCVVHDTHVAHSDEEPEDRGLINEQNCNILPGDKNLKYTSSEVFLDEEVPSSVRKSGHNVLNNLEAIIDKGGLKEETLNVVSSEENDDISRTKGVETEICKDLHKIHTEKNLTSDLQEYSRNCEDEGLLTMNIVEATTEIEQKSCKIENLEHQNECGEKMQNLGNQREVVETASPCIQENKTTGSTTSKLDHTNYEKNLTNSAEYTSRTYMENDEEGDLTSKMCASHSELPHLLCKSHVSNKIDSESDTETSRKKESQQEEGGGNLGSLLLVRQYGDECEQVEDNQIESEGNIESDKDSVEWKQEGLSCCPEQPSKQGNLTDNKSCKVFQENCNIDSNVQLESLMVKSDNDSWMSSEIRSKKHPSNQCSKSSVDRNDKSFDGLPFNCEHGILSHGRKCCCSAKHQFSISQSGGIESEQETSGLKVKPHCDHSVCPSGDEPHSISRRQISTSIEERKNDHGKFEVYLEQTNSGIIGMCPDIHQIERDGSAYRSRQERRRLSYDSREEPTPPKRKRRRSALVLQLDAAFVQKSLTQAMARLHAGSDFDVPCKQCGKFARHHVDGKCVFRPRSLAKKCREYWDPDCFKKPNITPDESSFHERNANNVFTSEGDGKSLEGSVVKLASSNLGQEDIEALDKIVEECGITLYEPRPNPPSQMVLPTDSMCTTKLVCTQTSVEQVPNSPVEKIQDQYSTGYKVFPAENSQNRHTCELAPLKDPRLKKLTSSTSPASSCLECAYDPEHPITSSPESIVMERITPDQKSQVGSSSKISKTKMKLFLPNEFDLHFKKPCDLDSSLTYLKTAHSFQQFRKPPRTPSPPCPSSPPSPLSSMSPISPQSFSSPLSSLSSILPPPSPPNLSLELCTVSQPVRHQSNPPFPPTPPNLTHQSCSKIQPEMYQSQPPLPPSNLNRESSTESQPERHQSNPPLPPTPPNSTLQSCSKTQPEMYHSQPPLPPLPASNLNRESSTVTQSEKHQSNPPLPPLPPTPPKSSFESCTESNPPLPPYPYPSQTPPPLPPLPPTSNTPPSQPSLLPHPFFHDYGNSGNRGMTVSSEQCDWSQMMSQRYVSNNQYSQSELYAPCDYNWRSSQSHPFTKRTSMSQSFFPSGGNTQGLMETPYDWSYTYSPTTWSYQNQNANGILHQQINEQSHRSQYGSRTVPSFPHTARPPQPPGPEA